MKKILAMFFCIMLLPSAAMAIDWTGVYVAPRLTYSAYTKMNQKGSIPGASYKGSEHDNGQWGGAIAIGWDSATLFNIPLRTEIEVGVQETAKGEFSNSGSNFKEKYEIYTLFLNGYYDFAVTWPAKPYIGLGVGMSLIDAKGNIDGESLGGKNNVNFAANAMAGFSFEVTRNMAIDLGYRFSYLGDAKTKSTGDYRMKTDDMYQHMGQLGFRFTF